MVCKTTSTVARKRAQAGGGLPDLLVATALGGLVLTCVAVFSLFGVRSFAAMANYVSLDQHSRNALDRMSKEIRQSQCLKAYATNSLWFQTSDGGDLVYTYDSGKRTLTRKTMAPGASTWIADKQPLLTGCDYLNFSIFQRNPWIGGVYGIYPAASVDTCKLVQLSWVCSRRIVGNQNTESVQSAKVVIRKG